MEGNVQQWHFSPHTADPKRHREEGFNYICTASFISTSSFLHHPISPTQEAGKEKQRKWGEKEIKKNHSFGIQN